MSLSRQGLALLLLAPLSLAPLCSSAGEVITLNDAFRLSLSTHESVAMAEEGLSQS
ncbi:MAG: hypothetical protein HY880_03195, partial [Deltaproteobacteria bacterium]|nr:hypothetical protein [Deltaproteobacteria bacterium]